MNRSRSAFMIAAVCCLLAPQLHAEVCPGSKVTKANLTTFDHHLADGLTTTESNAALARHLPFGQRACGIRLSNLLNQICAANGCNARP